MCYDQKTECYTIIYSECLKKCNKYLKYDYKGLVNAKLATFLKEKLFLARKQNYQKYWKNYDEQNFRMIKKASFYYNRANIKDAIELVEIQFYEDQRNSQKSLDAKHEEEEKKKVEEIRKFYSNPSNVEKNLDSELNIFDISF